MCVVAVIACADKASEKIIETALDRCEDDSDIE